MATWKPKKRVSVAPVDLVAAAQEAHHNVPTTGTAPAMSVPTLVAKKASSFHGRRYPRSRSSS